MSELIIALAIIALLCSPVAFAIWVVIRLGAARSEQKELKRRVEALELQLRPLPDPAPADVVPASTSATPAVVAPSQQPRDPVPLQTAVRPALTVQPALAAERRAESNLPPPLPPPLPTAAPSPTASVSPAESKPVAPPREPQRTWISWEDFLGVKLFAWIGALLLFLAAGFFIKYSFERDIITPGMRVTIGYALGAGLLVTAFRLNRERYAVTLQALASAAVLVFYGATYASHAMYGFFSLNVSFALMTGITAGAFLLAVRMGAQPVAVLGLAGGFLTPLLLSGGEDRPGALFSYVALLDVGLVAVALRQRWNYLVSLGWAGTAILQFAWWSRFFGPDKLPAAIASSLVFCALFAASFVAFQRFRRDNLHALLPALLAPGLALSFALSEVFGGDGAFANRPALLFAFSLAAAACWIGIARLGRKFRPAHFAAAVAMTTLVLLWSLNASSADALVDAMNLHLALAVTFIGLHAWILRTCAEDRLPGWAAVLAGGAALLFALITVANVSPARFPSLPRFFNYLFVADALLLVLASQRARWRPLHLPAGGAVFLILALWMSRHLTADTLGWAFGTALMFGILHTAYPVVLEKWLPGRKPVWWAQLFPLLSMALIALPVLKLSTGSTLLWPVVLIMAFAGMLVAAATGSALGVLALVIATLGVCGLWMFRLPLEPARLPEIVLVLGGLSVVMCVAAVWFQRRRGRGAHDGAWSPDPFSRDLETAMGGRISELLPAAPAALPFLLLTLLAAQMPMANPTPVFLLAAGLGAMVLALTRFSRMDALCGVGLAATALLELVWRANNFANTSPATALGWHLAFAALYFAFPFLFRTAFRDRAIPWIVSAAAFPLHFQFIHHSARAVWATSLPGLIPALLIVPPLGALWFLVRWLPADAPRRTTQLAVYASAVSFFVTLIFPIQFDKQWLTIGWALQGAAKLWLFRRIPHRGLKYAGAALLMVVFARLALNPAVLDYVPRSGTPLLNWYLYTYGLVAACLFTGAWFLRPQDGGAKKLRALLTALGTVLLFLLMNIEIADAFSTGERVSFEFSGHFGRDMAYSLGWTLFAAGLLAVGITRAVRAARWAGLALLGVTLVKLAFHDLWQLGGLYRVGSLLGMAVVLMLVSFSYQKLRARNTTGESTSEAREV